MRRGRKGFEVKPTFEQRVTSAHQADMVIFKELFCDEAAGESGEVSNCQVYRTDIELMLDIDRVACMDAKVDARCEASDARSERRE